MNDRDRDRDRDRDWAAYVMYVNRPDLLRRAVDSFPDLWPELTVIDNSGYGIDCDLPDSIAVFTPPVPLTYSQSMRWLTSDALARNKKFFLHFHSDAFSTNPAAVDELLASVQRYYDENRRWCCAYTFYDILWAVNLAALVDIGGWDPLSLFPTYFGDNDTARRWELRGWERINTNIQGLGHEGSATINSDPRLRFVNGQLFGLQGQVYRNCWGGGPGEETYKEPFGGATPL